MSTERRFTEEEIAAIFEDATETQKDRQKSSLPANGLTLAELQKIGHDLGLPADVIAQSATKLVQSTGIDHYNYEPTTTLGVDVGVNYTIDLPKPLSNESWEKLVVDIRHVFNAQGNITQNGALREWRTDLSDIEVMVEPTDAGQRLRIKSVNTNVQAGLALGATMSGVLLAFIAIIFAKDGDIATPFTVLTMLMSIALAVTFLSPKFMPEWKKKRNKQMQDIGARALELVTLQSGEKSDDNRIELPENNIVSEESAKAQINLDNLPDAPAENVTNQQTGSKNRA